MGEHEKEGEWGRWGREECTRERGPEGHRRRRRSGREQPNQQARADAAAAPSAAVTFAQPFATGKTGAVMQSKRASAR